MSSDRYIYVRESGTYFTNGKFYFFKTHTHSSNLETIDDGGVPHTWSTANFFNHFVKSCSLSEILWGVE